MNEDSNHKLCPECNGIMHIQSKICRICYIKGIIKPENYIKTTCPVCNKVFYPHISQKRRSEGIYCSRSCARSGSPTRKRKRKVISCYNCLNKFERHVSGVKRNKLGNHFCCPECWYNYNQREQHYLWKGGQDERTNPDSRQWKKAVWNRDKGFCRLCYSRNKVECHHIKSFTSYPNDRWKVENGILLCHKHHKKTFNHEDEYIEILSFLSSIEVII